MYHNERYTCSAGGFLAASSILQLTKILDWLLDSSRLDFGTAGLCVPADRAKLLSVLQAALSRQACVMELSAMLLVAYPETDPRSCWLLLHILYSPLQQCHHTSWSAGQHC